MDGVDQEQARMTPDELARLWAQRQALALLLQTMARIEGVPMQSFAGRLYREDQFVRTTEMTP